MKLEVGQKVFLKPINNQARYIKDDILNNIEEYEIKKVGRKYFEVWQEQREYNTLKFEIEDKSQGINYSRNWILYFSVQEIIDEIEADKLTSKIRDLIGQYGKINLSLNQLKRITDIIKEE